MNKQHVNFGNKAPFKCPEFGCTRSFDKYAGVRTHYYRAHDSSRKQESTQPAAEENHSFPVNCCPNCGNQLRTLHNLVASADEAMQLNFCPHCGYDIRPVAAAMAALERHCNGSR